MYQPEQTRLEADEYVAQLRVEANLWRSLRPKRSSWRSRAAAILIGLAARLEPQKALPERLS